MSRPKTLAPVRPSAAIEIAYRDKLERMIDAMQRSIMRWIPAAYRKHEPVVAQLMAQDAPPSRELQMVLNRLGLYWDQRFATAAQELADYFATETSQRTTAALQSILRRAGMTVRFKLTRATRDALRASINENVSLIRSIPAQHFTQIEGAVMRSVSAGRDLATLTNDLEAQYGVTRRRATLIARDQNNKATATTQRIRQAEAGITQAIWAHSGGGKEPRPTHVKAGRERVVYDIAKGWKDPALNKFIWPGTEINCRCVALPVVPGFS